ncbi:MAG: hypothetical protein K2X57_26310 [Xanthobacteraceae bacterium]|nr:hypothetical protein [Xanthobacteraceae bacterium]
MNPRAILTVLVAFLALDLASAAATDSHDYAPDEYAVIRDGLAPNKRMSLASHGADENYKGEFHVWLMAEPAHRKLARLPGIGPGGILDTGPNAYHASWSADSRHVAVTYRSDRHVVELNLYGVEGRRARLMSGPSLFKDVTSRETTRGDDVRRGVPEFEWKGTRRFLLRESRLFVTSDAGFLRTLGRYGRIGDKRDDGSFFVEFSAEADCVVLPGNRYRIVDLRVGKLGE